MRLDGDEKNSFLSNFVIFTFFDDAGKRRRIPDRQNKFASIKKASK